MKPDHLFCFRGTLTHVVDDLAADDDGDLVEHTTVTTVRYWLHQISAAEVTAFAHLEIGDAVVWLPADTTVGGLDHLSGDDGGGTWEFTGPPTRAANPRTGQVSHLELTAKAVA